MPKISEVIEHLKSFPADTLVAYDLWLPEDVITQAREEGKLCTDEQAAEVLEKMDSHKDSSVGMTWDTISYFLSEMELPDLPEEETNQ